MENTQGLQNLKPEEMQDVVLPSAIQTASLVDNLMDQAIWGMISQDTLYYGNYWLQNTLKQQQQQQQQQQPEQSNEILDVLLQMLAANRLSNPSLTILCCCLIKDLFLEQRPSAQAHNSDGGQQKGEVPFRIFQNRQAFTQDSIINLHQDSAKADGQSSDKFRQSASSQKPQVEQLKVSKAQQERLNQFYQQCRYYLMEAIEQNWCDALNVLFGQEWGKVRQHILDPKLDNTRDSLFQYMYSQLNRPRVVYKSGEYSSDQRQTEEFTQDARSASKTYEVVLNAIIGYQARELFLVGFISPNPPFQMLSYEELLKRQIVENTNVKLTPQFSFQCSVAFLKGQERHVCLTVGGFPIKTIDYDRPSCSSDESIDTTETIDTGRLVEMFRESVPMCVLVLPKIIPKASTYTEGKVLSIAPLIGAQAEIDPDHPRWLHIHVRPHVSILAEMLTRQELAWRENSFLVPRMKRVKGGHWVLSFADPQKAQRALEQLQKFNYDIKFYYHQMWQPILSVDQDPRQSKEEF